MLEFKNVSYAAPNGKEILKNIDLVIDDRFVAITGPNGSGKSTMAKLIAGIITPTEGRIVLDGVDITHMSITDRAKNGISFAFQQPVRFKGITVKDLISLAAGKNTNISEACAYLSEVGLCAKDYINREVDGSLSVFDEPEAGIDLWSFNNLIKVFENMYERTRGTIIIISHQERILNIADKIVVLAGGEVVEYGRKDDVFPKLMDVQSGCRYTQKV